jgi:serine/threonine-protein kinase
MKTLWPHEPARSRAEFAKLLKQAREMTRPTIEETPPASAVMEAAARQEQDPSLLAGTPYRLLEKIGEGASGEVFKAEHVELGRRYAVKVLSTAHAAAHDAVERFRREARTIAKLSHPNLVQLHDFGKSQDGRVFLAMELLAGKTLDQHAEKGLAWREASRLAIQATFALEAAHGAGLVHRDLKPQNLFLTNEGELKLLDFGVAMALADTAGEEKRQKGFAVFGTPEYMAPEQVAGESVDARCDVYALGCVLYELVTGSRPFEGSPVVVMGKQLRETAERPTHRAPTITIPAELEAVIVKALAKDKDDRFASAAAMREAIEEALAAPERRRGRARVIASALMGASLVVLAAAGFRGQHLHAPSWAPTWVKSRLEVSAPVAMDVSALPAANVADAPPVVEASNAPAANANAEAAPSADAPASSDAPAETTLTAATVPAKPEEAPKPEGAPKPHAKPHHDAPASGLLVRASATTESSKDNAHAKLSEARAEARSHASDPHALKGWATAALHAGELREARRAAESWAVHDASAEPRLFLAAALEAGNRRREARAVLEEWLANHPDAQEAKRMLARLGAAPEPAIKKGPRGRTRAQLHDE